MGIPTEILWEWELKFHSHGNPAALPVFERNIETVFLAYHYTGLNSMWSLYNVDFRTKL